MRLVVIELLWNFPDFPLIFSAFGQSLYNCESSILCLTPFCYFCTGHLCNYDMKPSLSCHVCNSTESCSQDLSKIDEFKRVCTRNKKTNVDSCYSVIDDKNQIHRGCYSEEQSICDQYSSKCIKCNDNNYCNHQEVIKSALVCFSCAMEDRQCPIERSTMSMTTKCLDHFSGQLESCYNTFEKATKQVQRGCSLDMDKSQVLRTPTTVFSYCDSHFCNSEGFAVRKCLSCTGQNVNSTCHSLDADAAVKMVTECHSVPGLVEASSCYTLFWNRTTILRGCLNDMTKGEDVFCKQNANKFCFSCTEDTCNKMKLWYESCFICHQNCTEKVVGGETAGEYRSVVIEPKTCENVSTGERNGCFLQVLDGKEGGQWKQGCIADMTAEEYKMCLADEKKCQTCTGGKCNYKLKKSGKGRIVQMGESGGGSGGRDLFIGTFMILMVNLLF